MDVSSGPNKNMVLMMPLKNQPTFPKRINVDSNLEKAGKLLFSMDVSSGPNKNMVLMMPLENQPTIAKRINVESNLEKAGKLLFRHGCFIKIKQKYGPDDAIEKPADYSEEDQC
ncbi:hypothetical protein AVEN_275132-1 [Araneus ventricosus]|uniref:Uncharacterized protein n=1 Tax=Araneus ventricosus TaxID=182803 RepID=A0A4Y2UL63_ARAVE|nr:hypothetical protein AVEN_275132-1 [Araneus ventricosus]